MTNWQAKKLGELLTIRHGRNQREVESADGEYPILGTGGEMGRATKYLYDKPSVLIGRKGTIDKPRYMDTPFWTVDTLFYSEIKSENVPKFLYYIFNTIDWRQYNEASGVPSLSASTISTIKVSVPEKPEQERIVGVLEVWDEYIEKLEQKIALKEQLKKGLMQQLLTGKRRLPGFSDGWQMTTVGSLGRIVSGGTPDTSKSEYWGGEIDWITPTEITKIKWLINKPTKKRITNAGLRASSTFVLPPSSLVLCSRATIGECAINETEITTNQGFKNIIPNRKVDVWYLYYWIKQNKKLLLRISSGSTFLEYSKKDLERLKINLPGLDEQLCVARVLKNIDKQIENYEAKKILIESQKKYLLKNLITGAIRTPEDLQPLDTSRLERSAL